jgi:hypothetical protein
MRGKGEARRGAAVKAITVGKRGRRRSAPPAVISPGAALNGSIIKCRAIDEGG